ncbi:MAG TPA: GtrA family protein [Burkholderiales bacterium]|nr:GtrA family protein [Burkholderiales bacterium]
MPAGRLVKFTVIGLSIAVFHYMSAVLMVDRVGLAPALANSIAFLAAAALSYTLQTLWTFESRFTARNAIRFVVVLLVGVAVSWGTSTAVAALGLPYRLGVIIVLFLIPALNFLLHHFWTYAEPAA